MSESTSSSFSVSLVLLFIVWYAFNAGYNVYNAHCKALGMFPITIAFLQLLVGLVYALPLWMTVRKVPTLRLMDFVQLFPIAALTAVGHTCTVIATFQKGGGSLAHVIKASEPVVSVVLGLLINGIVPKPLTAISLLPITYGVAYASTLGKLDISTISKELTTVTAIMAMIGNICFALRSIIRKNLPSDFKSRTGLDAANDHAVTTIYAAILTIPCLLYYEDLAEVEKAFHSLSDPSTFLRNLFICGLCFYIYNEMQNIVLGSLGPVPTAVGNTLKRVVIFVALFVCIPGETFPEAKVVGCAIAIAGCLCYAICDSKKL